jgi:tRNA pseudouridine38-40 synthase
MHGSFHSSLGIQGFNRPTMPKNTPPADLTNWLVKYARTPAFGKCLVRLASGFFAFAQNRPEIAHICGPWSSTLLCGGWQHMSIELQNWRVTLAYDGTDFQGWQIQPGQPTIQGELQAALGRVMGETPLPQGSGRTDAGVHAQAQVASFPLRAPIPPENLLRALNRTLPPSIRILEARTTQSTFHARHSAIAKTYEYRIVQGSDCSPFQARYVYCCPWKLDVELLEAAARLFSGEHDFQSFAATDPDLAERSSGTANGTADEDKTIRTIFSSHWEVRSAESGHLLVYTVRGNGFLHHMVRNLVGTMLDAGRGFLPLEEIPGILAARSRSAAGPTAPARGLFLVSVDYPPQEE